ncbi:hypothetical protein VaNZ11_016316 [Volvox africanus]|uniref:Aminotransferase class V domain-containing protein n=1 Tax=Volvox africanus TaxID=51714 RepID=A0ABQ5SP86_9CHLO|nr:hypothetical protein VaNZ11_016316 [Volvox africanus]
MAPPSSTPVVTRTGYQNFGSFFTENVEDLICIPKDSYIAPEPPFTPPSLGDIATLDFGEPCRQLFNIDFENWTFINHGAFGAVCRAAHQESNQWREHCESQPLRFLDRQLFPHMVRVMREMADFIGADPRDLVFVPNATTGLNVAIQAAGLRPGDTMYMLNIGYGSVKKMAQAALAAAAGRGAGTAPAPAPAPGADITGGEAPGDINVVYGEVTFPLSSPRDIVDLVAATMPPNTRLAVFDSVTSNTALVMPVSELTRLCKSRGVQVLIDGAHALGQLHLDMRRGICGGTYHDSGSSSSNSGTKGDGHQTRPLQQVGSPATASVSSTAATVEAVNIAAATATAADVVADVVADVAADVAASAGPQGSAPGNLVSPELDCVPDYFVSNCHKWLCAPRGSAILWVAPNRQAFVRPLVVSHGSGCGFTSDFIWDGCRDYAPYLATSSALALWRLLGPPRIRAYCRGLLGEAVALLTARWGTTMLAPFLQMCGCMALVELPRAGLAETEPATSTDAKYVQDLLHHVHAVECPVKCIQGRLYVRISVHIYNILSDYERLAEAVDRIAASNSPSQAQAPDPDPAPNE